MSINLVECLWQASPCFLVNVIIASLIMSLQAPAGVAGPEREIPGQTQHDYQEEPHETRELNERSTETPAEKRERGEDDPLSKEGQHQIFPV